MKRALSNSIANHFPDHILDWVVCVDASDKRLAQSCTRSALIGLAWFTSQSDLQVRSFRVWHLDGTHSREKRTRRTTG